jgi:hypothetical protein
MRTARTLLVEGETDKTVIQRMLLEHPLDERSVADRPVIDTPTILSDNALSGLGHKEQVELIARSCASEPGKFIALVDREWEGFDSETLEIVANDHEYHQIATTMIKTFGHSIENYFFDHATFASLLRRQFPGGLNAGMLRLVEEQFPRICEFALSYSLAAKDMHLISRLDGVLSRKHIQVREDYFELNEAFVSSLLTRAVDMRNAQDFITMTRDFQRKILDKKPSDRTIKWASHGHLGGAAIWACIAKLLELSGMTEDTCNQVERGLQSDKLKHGADVVATGPHERRPLEWLAKWLLSIDEAQLA